MKLSKQKKIGVFSVDFPLRVFFKTANIRLGLMASFLHAGSNRQYKIIKIKVRYFLIGRFWSPKFTCFSASDIKTNNLPKFALNVNRCSRIVERSKEKKFKIT